MSILSPHEDGRLLITTAAQQNTSSGGKHKGGLLSQRHGQRVLDIPAINKKENGVPTHSPARGAGRTFPPHPTPISPLHAAAASSAAPTMPDAAASQTGRLVV